MVFGSFNCDYTHKKFEMDEIMVKGAKGAKVKVLFQGLHMTHSIPALVYNLKFYILNAPFSTTF
jgi:hypothetical protein